jgi:membrane-bound lytic murein transglycosylase B
MLDKHLGCATLVAAFIWLWGAPALAAPCGNNSAGFEAWKRAFAGEAQAAGIGPSGIAALMATDYSVGTIRADRGMKC